MRVLVCGGRDYTDEIKLRIKLDELHSLYGFTVVITGGAPGADRLAHTWARTKSLQTEEYVADWNKLGKSAGPLRNQKMLDEGQPELFVAFPTENSIGTWDMIKRATNAGINGHVYE